MVNDFIKKVRFIFLFALFCMPLSAQSRFKQRVEWESEPNALEYKVEIELLELDIPDTDNAAPGEKTPATTVEPSSIQKTHFFNTTETFIEFSYEPGRYRYRVYAYDFLGRETSVSDWREFEITRALEPKVSVRESVTVEKGSNENLVIPVDLDSITPESVVVLVDPETHEEIQGEIQEDPEYPGAQVVVFPPIKKPDYKIKITNPGGLTTETDLLDIAFVKKPHVMKYINIQAGAGVLFSFGQTVFTKYNNQTSFTPVINFKISFFPVRFEKSNFGFEIGAQGTTVNYKNSMIDINLPTEFCELSFLWQYEFIDDILDLNVKIGAILGFTQEVLLIGGVQYDVVSYTYPGALTGAYLVWYPFKYFSVEAGAEFSVLFDSGKITPLLIPVINIGARF